MPKYQEIAGWLERNIWEGRYLPGQKLPSEQALREKFQVSRQTVRKALEVLEQEGLVYGRQGSGTYVSDLEEEEKGKSRQIAVVTTYVDNYIFPRIIQGIEGVLSREGFQVQIAFTNNRIQKEEEILKTLLDQDLRGLIVEAAKSALPNPNLPLYRKLLERGTRILFLNSGYPELDCPVAALDDREAGRCAARFLLEMGHRELGGLLKSDDGQGLLRYQGFITELREAGIRTEDDRFVWYDTGDIGRFDRMEQRILERLAGCSAVFCYNDSAAVELMELLGKNGIRVPEELAVIGFDDDQNTDYLNPALTTVHQPLEEFGRLAVDYVLAKMEEPEKLIELVIEPKLIERESA